MSRASVLPCICALGVLIAGCGGEGGVSSGATVSVYVGRDLCVDAKRQLSREEGRAGSIRVRVVCLASERDGNRLDLATTGANARRATEDSAAIAYLEAPDATAARFTHPILESAGIAWVSASSGASGMARVLRAVRDADSASLRESVREALRQT